jgi:hypothetical protein
MSLIDRSQLSPAPPPGHNFRNVEGGYYWTSTTYSFETYSAWVIDPDLCGDSGNYLPLDMR